MRAVVERDAHAAVTRVPAGRFRAEAQLRARGGRVEQVRVHSGFRKQRAGDRFVHADLAVARRRRRIAPPKLARIVHVVRESPSPRARERARDDGRLRAPDEQTAGLHAQRRPGARFERVPQRVRAA